MHGLFHGGKAANARSDNCGGAVALGIADWSPGRLSDCLIRGGHRELDKAIHSQSIFQTDGTFRIEAALGVLRQGRHNARNLRGYVLDEVVGQPPYAGPTSKKPSPDQARAATERLRNISAAGPDGRDRYGRLNPLAITGIAAFT